MDDQSVKVPVESFPQVFEAQMVQMKLDAAGIESALDGEYTVAANPLYSNAVGWVKVLVREEDLEDARCVIEDYRHAAAEQYEAARKTCPECGSTGGREIRRPLILGILTGLTLGALVLLIRWPQFKCPDCGHKWRCD